MKKRITAFLLTLIAIVCLFVTPAFAASTRKCYTISSGNTAVYSDTGLSDKYGTIFGTDEITVLDVTGSYCKVTYPISGGRTKTGYIETGAIFCGTTGDSYTSREKITTYKRSDGSSYGYIGKSSRPRIDTAALMTRTALKETSQQSFFRCKTTYISREI